jgi:hypothetical protein
MLQSTRPSVKSSTVLDQALSETPLTVKKNPCALAESNVHMNIATEIMILFVILI